MNGYVDEPSVPLTVGELLEFILSLVDDVHRPIPTDKLLKAEITINATHDGVARDVIWDHGNNSLRLIDIW